MPVIWDCQALVITTTGRSECHYEGFCEYPESRELDVWGTFMQGFAAGEAAKKSGIRPYIVLLSALASEETRSFELDPSQFYFHKLSGEANIMSLGLNFAVVKPCRLNGKPAGKEEILSGPTGSLVYNTHSAGEMSRHDLAKLVVSILTSLEVRTGPNLRFDVCGGRGGQPTDLDDPAQAAQVLQRAHYLSTR